MSYDGFTLGRQPLEYRRVFNDFVLYYIIKSGLIDTDISNDFIVVNNLCTRGHSNKLMKQHCTIDATKFYFSNLSSVFGTLYLNI